MNLIPVTPDETLSSLHELITAFHQLGHVELDEDERKAIAAAQADLDQLSRQAMNQLNLSP